MIGNSLIVEADFITNLFINLNNGCENTDDLYRFLTADFRDYTLICDFKDIDEYQKASSENPIWELILDKIDKIVFDKNLQTKLDNDKFYKKIGEHNLFLTNLNKDTCQTLTDERGYLYFCTDNIKDNWNVFRQCKNSFKLKVTHSKLIPDPIKLDTWEKIEKFSHPLTSIVIFDKYILKDSSNQKMIDNICPLLEKILGKKPALKTINITVITELKTTEKFKEKHELISEWLKKKGIENFSLNIIKHHKRLYPSDFEGLHSRFILTNCFHVSATDSFNFFKSNGKVNNDVDVIFNFSFRKENAFFYKKELNDLRRYVSSLSNNPTSMDEECKETYFPSKDNYLFN